MSVGMVTARSHLGAANIGGAPRSASITKLRVSTKASRMRIAARRNALKYSKSRYRSSAGAVQSAQRLPRIVRTRIPASVAGRAATTVAQKFAILKMAKILARTISRSTPLTIIAGELGHYIYNKVVEPEGFPGFDAIAPGWRKPLYTGEIGSYAPNSFDHGLFDNPPESLLDTNDIVNFTIRYWGDFNVNPYPDAGPGLNWPILPRTLPFPEPITAPAPSPAPQRLPERVPRLRYRKVRDLSDRTRPRPRWRPTRNMEITLNTRPGATAAQAVRLRRDVPRVRTNDNKASPSNQAIYLALLTLANAMGETKEWIDILAEAAGYDPRAVPIFTGGGHETLRKAAYVFLGGGINNIDFDLLRELIRENTVEDAVFGFFGNLAKVGSRRLGLTVGVQAGPGF